MQCNSCGKKKATVHLTEIIDNQATEMHLCEECARSQSVKMEQQFGLADLLAGLAEGKGQAKDLDKTSLTCPSCGLTYEDFRKFGRFGCAECYTAFHEQLVVLLKKIHGSNQHLGKSPDGARPRVSPAVSQAVTQAMEEKPPEAPETADGLKAQLQTAIMAEDFEKAAHLRDKIRGLEQK